MKEILCFGDSNTWGYTPGTGERYPYDVRWTTVMAKDLGDDYRVAVDGLNGRTTVYEDPWYGCTRGNESIGASLLAHSPLDLVILSLGTNDLKFVPAVDAARGAARLIGMIKNADAVFAACSPVAPNGIKILLVSPIELGENLINIDENSTLAKGISQSKLFPEHYRRVAEETGVYYINAAEFAAPSETDAVHMTPEGHSALGHAIAAKVKEIFTD